MMMTHRALAAGGASTVRAITRRQHPPSAVFAATTCQKRPLVPGVFNTRTVGGRDYGSSVPRKSLSSVAVKADTRAAEEKEEQGKRGKGAKGREDKEDDDDEEEEVRLAHTIVTHPPAPGWKYPRPPNGIEAEFAVFALANTQYKVAKDDVIVADKVRHAEIGTTLEMEKVLLVGTPEHTLIGRPYVAGAKVKLFVEEQTKDKKIIVFKKRRRKSSKTTKGHRREVTMLRVVDISSIPVPVERES